MDDVEFLRQMRPFIHQSAAPLPIGRDGRIRVNYFIDLLSAVHEPALLDDLARTFAHWLKTTRCMEAYDALATPKRGNALLTYRVAQLLRCRCGFVKENILFGRWLEGEIRSGDRALLIDDVASDGELLADAVIALQRSGVFADHVAVLVSRAEGDAMGKLASLDVGISSRLQLSDADLARAC